VRQANLILVLEKGRIAAQGNHQELLQRSALYAEIYERQLRPQAQKEEAQREAQRVIQRTPSPDDDMAEQLPSATTRERRPTAAD
jgi:ABC-type multidrug transport system ATPase subunit